MPWLKRILRFKVCQQDLTLKWAKSVKTEIIALYLFLKALIWDFRFCLDKLPNFETSHGVLTKKHGCQTRYIIIVGARGRLYTGYVITEIAFHILVAGDEDPVILISRLLLRMCRMCTTDLPTLALVVVWRWVTLPNKAMSTCELSKLGLDETRKEQWARVFPRGFFMEFGESFVS